MQTTAADERIFRWKEHRQKLLPKPVVEVLHRKEVDVSPVIQQMSKKIQPSAVKRVSANSTRIMPVMQDTLVFPVDMQTAAGRQSAAVLYVAADRGIWAADCRPASERRKGMEQLTDYSINFPHLHIYLHHVGKNIMIGNFSVAYYGIVIAIGMLAGLGIACWMAKRTGQKTDTYFDLALVAIICSVIGARVYYVIFRWDLYKDDLLSVFNLRQGGLAIYGGVIAAIITVFVFSRVRKLSMGLLCDTAGLGLVLGQVIGRWGNFFNREAFGGYTNNLFAMQIKLDEVGGVISDSVANHIKVVNGIEYIQVHPTFLYESLWNLCLFIGIMLYRKHKKFEGELASIYMIGYGIGRFFIESLRTDQLVIKGIGIAISQVVSIILIIAGITIIIRNRCKLRRDMKQSIQ